MTLDLVTFAVVGGTVFMTAFMKGAFGGGFAIVGIPLLSLVMDPISAGALLSPLFCVSDAVAYRYWRASSWARRELAVMIPGLVLGTSAGYLVLRYADRNLTAIVIALLTLLFAGLWFKGGAKVVARPRSDVKGFIAGTASGLGSMIAHSGGPPAAMYLLPLGLPKSQYAGTTFMFFVVGNLLKVIPWLALITVSRPFVALLVLSVPMIVAGTWAGWRLHERLDQAQLYRACYSLLVVVGTKLLWDGLRGYGVV